MPWPERSTCPRTSIVVIGSSPSSWPSVANGSRHWVPLGRAHAPIVCSVGADSLKDEAVELRPWSFRTSTRSSSASTGIRRSPAGSTRCLSRTRGRTPGATSAASANRRLRSPTWRRAGSSGRSACAGTSAATSARSATGCGRTRVGAAWSRARSGSSRGSRSSTKERRACNCAPTSTTSARAAPRRRPASRSRACSARRTGTSVSAGGRITRCTRCCRATSVR